MKYENGYLPRIAYHMAANNPESVAHFTERQEARYGRLTAEDMVFITHEVAKLQRIWANEMREFNSHLG